MLPAIPILLTLLASATGVEWKQLPQLPDKEGFAGSFAGVSRGAVLVAGGANFPDKKPWEGGKKVWHDAVFVLEKPNGSWKVADKLPRLLGYGVCVTHGDGVVCVGGSDSERHHADAFRLEWKAGRLVTTKLPSLPKPVANACGALVGDTLYVAGGIEKPDATTTLKSVIRLDLSVPTPKWEEIDPCPGGGRMLAVAAAFDDAFWLVGGVDLAASGERRYLSDAYRDHPKAGWKRIADVPSPVAAAPSPAPADASGFHLLGGDDGTQVGIPHDRHRGFRKQVLRYDAKADRWIDAGQLPAARVTVPCVRWNDSWVVPCGEARPGVRSPDVWAFTPRK